MFISGRSRDEHRITCTQDILHKVKVLQLFGLKVKFSLLLERDNKEAVDLVNNFSVGC